MKFVTIRISEAEFSPASVRNRASLGPGPPKTGPPRFTPSTSRSWLTLLRGATGKSDSMKPVAKGASPRQSAPAEQPVRAGSLRITQELFSGKIVRATPVFPHLSTKKGSA